MKRIYVGLIVMGLMLAPAAAFAGESAMGNTEIVNLGLVDMPVDEFRTMQDMVTGQYRRDSQALNSSDAESVDLGFMSMPHDEIQGIENLMAGKPAGQETIATTLHEVVSIGLVDMDRGELEALRHMVMRGIASWDGTFADAPAAGDGIAGR